MTSVAQTQAEQGLLAQFKLSEASLPGDGWVRDLRRENIRTFADLGLPHRRIEAWKYTDVRERWRVANGPAPVDAAAVGGSDIDRALGALAAVDAYRMVFVDGHYAAHLSNIDALGGGIEVKALAPVLAGAPAWLQSKFTAARVGAGNAITALNLAFMSDGTLLKIKSGQAPAKPIMLVMARSSGASAASVTARHIVSVESDAKATLIEAHVALSGSVSDGAGNYATDVDVANGAVVDHIKIAGVAADAMHCSEWRVRIGEGATYRGFNFLAGLPFVRHGITVGFTGEGAKLDVSGVFLGRDRDHIDTTLVVDHSTPGCESRELFKGVLDGSARGVFQGKIIVRPVAQKTDGKQMSQALMLSENAEFDSKPELEIYADDVACGHGATAAELDPDMLFYLRSRGIPKAEARAMLIESFIGEAIEKIQYEPLREAARTMALNWLAQGKAGTTKTSDGDHE